MDVAAHQQQIRPKGLHHVELAFGAVQVALALRLRHRLEVAEGLEAGDRQAQAGREIADVVRGSVERQQIVFEDFHPVEPDGGGGLQLFRQCPTEGDGGDGLLHACLASVGVDG
jgi:hypothetical protein